MKNTPKVLVLGGSSGIGLAVINLFRSENYEVINISRTPCKVNDVSNITLDFSKKDIDLLVPKNIQIIIDCIGTNTPAKFEDIKDDDLDNMFEINIKSKFRVLKKLLKNNSPSHVIIVSSIWGVSSRKGRSVYSATKHALTGLVKTLALEYADQNCLINLVSPGFTLTELTARTNTVEELEKIESHIPLKRLAQPIEIARLIRFLASEENTYISGQNIIIDGGFTI